MIRAVILSATIAALVTMWMDQPAPFKPTKSADYCVIDQHTASKVFGVYPDGSPALDENGEQRWRWRFSWQKAHGLCSLLDRFENI